MTSLEEQIHANQAKHYKGFALTITQEDAGAAGKQLLNDLKKPVTDVQQKHMEQGWINALLRISKEGDKILCSVQTFREKVIFDQQFRTSEWEEDIKSFCDQFTTNAAKFKVTKDLPNITVRQPQPQND